MILWIVAGVFGLGMLLLLIDKVVGSSEMNLALPARILIFIAMILVLYCAYTRYCAEQVRPEASTEVVVEE
jgi:hypothetical protein